MWTALSLYGLLMTGVACLGAQVIVGGSRSERLLAGLCTMVLLPYFIFLGTRSIECALWVTALPAAAGLWLGIRRYSGSARAGWFTFIACAIFVWFASEILLRPISDVDARAIWFFHAKVMHFEGGLSDGTYLADQAVAFSHPGYPKLLAFHAALFPCLAGFWNEYIPRFGLLALFAPLFVFLSGLARKDLRHAMFAVVCLGWLYQWVWNGYADFYLALYGLMAMYFLDRFGRSGRGIELALSMLGLGVAVSLKNEGLLLLIVYVGCAVAFCRHKLAGLKGSAFCWSLVPIFSAGLWQLVRTDLGVETGAHLGSESLELVARRLADGSCWHILAVMLEKQLLWMWALGCVILAILRRRISLFLAAAILYLGGIFFAYLFTCVDLDWHLATSARRTILPALVLMMFAVFDRGGSTDLCVKSVSRAARDFPVPGNSWGPRRARCVRR